MLLAKRGESTHFEDAFRQGLTQAGYLENKNVVIEWRWAEGRYERLPGILAELAGRRVAAIAVPASTAAALAGQASRYRLRSMTWAGTTEGDAVPQAFSACAGVRDAVSGPSSP